MVADGAHGYAAGGRVRVRGVEGRVGHRVECRVERMEGPEARWALPCQPLGVARLGVAQRNAAAGPQSHQNF